MELIYEKESYGTRDQRWIRSQHGTSKTVVPCMLDMTDPSWNQETHFPIGYLISGIPLIYIVGSDGLFKPWLAPSDGDMSGFLLSGDQKVVNADGTVTTASIAVDIFTHGMVRLAYLPVPASTDAILALDLPKGIIASLGD